MQLSNTSVKILSVLLANSDQSFYINELIRHTSSYPNSIYSALKTLEKQKIVTSFYKGRFKFFQINQNYEFLTAIKNIINSQNILSPELKPKWVKLLNRETAYAFNFAICRSNTNNLKEIYGIDVPTFWCNGLTNSVYYDQNELIALGKRINQLLDKNMGFADKDINLCKLRANKLIKVSNLIFKSNLKDKTNKELYEILDEFYKNYLNLFPFMTTPHAIERYFEAKIREAIGDEEDLAVLLSPVFIRNEEMENLLKIASYVKKHEFDKHYQNLIIKHWENYCWLPLFSLNAKSLSIDYFADEIKNILSKKDPEKELIRMKTEQKERINKLEQVFKDNKAGETLKKQVDYLQEYIQLRTYRKNILCQAHFYHLPLLNEIAFRMKLTTDDIKFLDYPEVLNWLDNGYESKGFNYSLNQLKALITKRIDGWAIFMWKGKINTVYGTKNIIATMEQYQIVHSIPNQPRIISGSVASRGKVRGRVKIVRNLKELYKVEKGDVLVAKMTTPDFMIAINRAVAIVTDEGGVTCHAAIVAREFNIPCITGTRIATKTLSDNDLIEVDAFEGKVRILETITVPEDIKILSGRTIYKGKVRGIARIVLDSNDFQKIKPGDILITSQTTPEYLSLLYRVNGFVVDEDSFTSHAVVYGKALKIPSIMGTQFARSVIQDGEKIELDATSGLIKRLN